MATVAWLEAFVKPVDADVTKNDAYYQKEVIDYLKANGMTEEDLADYNIVATTQGVTVEFKEDEPEQDEPEGDEPEQTTSNIYFGQKYSGTLEDGTKESWVFYEDGSAHIYTNDVLRGERCASWLHGLH